MGPGQERPGRWRVFATPVVVGYLLALAVWVLMGAHGGTGFGAGSNRPAAAPDTGVMTLYPLPPNRGPWQLKWDDTRNTIWFAEGNHSDPPLDQVAALDVTNGSLREWGIPTTGGYAHGTALDRNHDFWFTEVRINKIGRLQPESNTITEWTIDQSATPHSLTVDDITPGDVTVWISERIQNVISSLNPATNEYRRHVDPLDNAQPHSVVVAPDHSVWFVETCGNRVGQLVSSDAGDTWRFWQPPTSPASCGPPLGIGPLFGNFVGSDFWYSEPYNGNLIRLRTADNTMEIYRLPGGGSGNKLITQSAGDPDGNIFFPEMNRPRIGRFEPQGASTPTVVAVTPVVVNAPAPPLATAIPIQVVYTPIVSQITPISVVVTGTRTAGFTEWTIPTPIATSLPGRFIGPGRAWYGGGGFWASVPSYDEVLRFAPYTPLPGSPTVTRTATPTFTQTPTAVGTATPSNTPTPTAPALTLTPTAQSTAQSTLTPTSQPTGQVTASATLTPCAVQFSDVGPNDYFYQPVLYLYCHGAISGYSDGTFRPYNNTTRGQLTKIIVLAEGWPIRTTGGPHFSDVPPSNPFYGYIETAYIRGVISGYSDGTFRWGNNVTRAQLSKIVVNSEAWTIDTSGGPHFSDVPPTDPFYTFIETAYNHTVISGYADGTFRPGNNATRGQISKIVYNAITQP